MSSQLHVALDIGNCKHRAAIGLNDGRNPLEEFDVVHTAAGLREFFARVRQHQQRHGATVAVAMEGYGGYARPIDTQVLAQGWRLFAVNNLKFARFKEIFPAPAKTDAIDTRRLLQLMQMHEQLPMAQALLQEVAPIDERHQQLKALTRRRRQLVEEQTRVSQRMQADLQAVAPGLLEITGQADNEWFLNLLTCRNDLRQLAKLRRGTLLRLRRIGTVYATKIMAWQADARFAPAVQWLGRSIHADARRLLALHREIAALEGDIAVVAADSAMARRIQSVPGFGAVASSELAAEIGSIARFGKESSFAVYLGVAPLDDSSGKRVSAKLPRQVNPRARAALVIATVRHMSQVPESRAYYERKRAGGKTHSQAVRALARQLSRVLYRMLTHDRDYRSPNQGSEKNP